MQSGMVTFPRVNLALKGASDDESYCQPLKDTSVRILGKKVKNDRYSNFLDNLLVVFPAIMLYNIKVG